LVNGNILRLKFQTPKTSTSSAFVDSGAEKKFKEISSSSALLNHISSVVDSMGSVRLTKGRLALDSFYVPLTATYMAKGDSTATAAKKAIQYINGTKYASVQQELARSFNDSLAKSIKDMEGVVSNQKADSLEKEKNNWLNADEFIRIYPNKTKSFLQMFSNGDTSVTDKIKNLNSDISDFKNISYVLLALQDSDDINKYFDSLKNINPTKNDSIGIRIKMDDIKRLVTNLSPKTNDGHFSLYASGDFLTTVQSSSISGSSNITSGTIGGNYKNGNFGFTAKIILLSTQDTVTNGYGTQLLSPAKGKGFGTGILGLSYDLPKSNDKLQTWSAKLFISGSSQHWRGDSSTLNNLDSINANKDSIFTSTATILGFDLLANYCIQSKDSLTIGSNKYAMAFNCNIGFAERLLGGDILKPLKNPNSILYSKGYYPNRFPTTRSAFFGLEAGISISVGPILAEFTVYDFFNSSKDKQSLPGLTGLQPAFGASITLNLYHN
jgi:hypothetical protein